MEVAYKCVSGVPKCNCIERYVYGTYVQLYIFILIALLFYHKTVSE